MRPSPFLPLVCILVIAVGVLIGMSTKTPALVSSVIGTSNRCGDLPLWPEHFTRAIPLEVPRNGTGASPYDSVVACRMREWIGNHSSWSWVVATLPTWLRAQVLQKPLAVVMLALSGEVLTAPEQAAGGVPLLAVTGGMIAGSAVAWRRLNAQGWGYAEAVRQLVVCGRGRRWQWHVVAAVRLLFWHLAQPALYFAVFYAYAPRMDDLQFMLGVGVLLREVVYVFLACAAACADRSASILLVGHAATRRSHAVHAVLCVLSPERVVAAAVGVAVEAARYEGGCVMSILSPLSWFGDACAVGALCAGFHTGRWWPAMAAGYALTAASLLSSALFMCCAYEWHSNPGAVVFRFDHLRAGTPRAWAAMLGLPPVEAKPNGWSEVEQEAFRRQAPERAERGRSECGDCVLHFAPCSSCVVGCAEDRCARDGGGGREAPAAAPGYGAV